jgi:hypothetical protein
MCLALDLRHDQGVFGDSYQPWNRDPAIRATNPARSRINQKCNVTS